MASRAMAALRLLLLTVGVAGRRSQEKHEFPTSALKAVGTIMGAVGPHANPKAAQSKALHLNRRLPGRMDEETPSNPWNMEPAALEIAYKRHQVNHQERKADSPSMELAWERHQANYPSDNTEKPPVRVLGDPFKGHAFPKRGKVGAQVPDKGAKPPARPVGHSFKGHTFAKTKNVGGQLPDKSEKGLMALKGSSSVGVTKSSDASPTDAPAAGGTPTDFPDSKRKGTKVSKSSAVGVRKTSNALPTDAPAAAGTPKGYPDSKRKANKVSMGATQMPQKEYQYGVRTAEDPPVEPAEALQMLKKGNARFLSGKVNFAGNFDQEHREALAEYGQRPVVSVLGCADSRAPIELMFDAQPGDLFVLRNAGNTLSNAKGSVVGSLEYSINVLGVKLILVIGHSKCGALLGASQTLLNSQAEGGKKPETMLDRVLNDLGPVVEQAQTNLGGSEDATEIAREAVKVNVFTGMERLLIYSESIREAVVHNEVEIHGAVYDIETGKVEFLGQLPMTRKYRYMVRTAEDPPVPPEDALALLIRGNARFMSGNLHFALNFGEGTRKALADYGQRPVVSILGCADSRAPLELMFDAQPGDLFVLRNAGNTLANARGSVVGSIEYSVDVLGVKLILVLGHTRCGALLGASQSLLSAQKDGAQEEETMLDRVLTGLGPVVEQAQANLGGSMDPTEIANAATKVNVLVGMKRLLTYSDSIRRKVESGEVQLHGAVYDIRTGKVQFLGEIPKLEKALDMQE